MKQKTRDGILLEYSDSQDRLLAALYGSAAGRLLIKPLIHPAVSRLGGRLLSTRASRLLIKPFIKRCGIDMSQFLPENHRSYNEFFSRKIRPELRPIDMNKSHLISPCDSKLTALPITAEGSFCIKHTRYSISSLLRDDVLAQNYIGGTALIFRLTVDDYHRYCYSFDGTAERSVTIPGVLHTVNPIANDHYPIYKENAREYTLIRTGTFGNVVMMEVGALLVGKIVNHPIHSPVRRGTEKGYFQFGGSTVVLLLEPGAAIIDPDILENSARGIETVVKYGERIGCKGA